MDLASQSLTALLTQKPPSSLTREQVHTRVHTRTGSSERERGRGEADGFHGFGNPAEADEGGECGDPAMRQETGIVPTTGLTFYERAHKHFNAM